MEIAIIVFLFFVAVGFAFATKHFAKEAEVKEKPETYPDDYVGFLQKSRDEAYEYIGQVQGAISLYKKEVEPVLDYFDKYYVASSTHLDAGLIKIRESYNRLIEDLPK